MLNSSKLTSYEVKLPISLPFSSPLFRPASCPVNPIGLLLPSLRLVEATRPEKFKKKCRPNGFGLSHLEPGRQHLAVAEAWRIRELDLASGQPCHLAAV